MRRAVPIALMVLTMALPVRAVQPDEMLQDPAMETRAREISRVLRCPVCQGETIDDSNAGISRDLRLFLRERLVAGDSDSAAVDAITARYGEYVLFEPRATGTNMILWLAGPVMALLGLGLAYGYIRRRKAAPAPAPLSDDEQARLARIMRDEAP